MDTILWVFGAIVWCVVGFATMIYGVSLRWFDDSLFKRFLFAVACGPVVWFTVSAAYLAEWWETT